MRGKWNEGKAFARKKGFTDESLEKLEKFMEDEGILTHQAAIPYFQELNPPPVPASNSGSRWDFFGPEQYNGGVDMKLLYEGKDDEFLDKTVRDTLNKVRSGDLSR